MKDSKEPNEFKNENTKKVKNNYYLKIKKYNQSQPIIIRREFEYSSLGNYEQMYDIIKNAILILRKEKGIDNHIPILILYHPTINEIFIYSKEQWDFYYKFNIIDECLYNKSLKIDFILIYSNKKHDDINKKLILNKKNVTKYLIKKIPLNIYLDISLNFFESRDDICKIFQNYMINELINDDMYSFKTTKDAENSLEVINEEFDNLDINSIINPGEKKDKKKAEVKNNNINIKEYIVENNEFINTLKALKDQSKIFSKNKKYLSDIQNVVEEENENKEINKNVDEEKKVFNSNFNLVPGKSFDHLLKDEDSYDNITSNNLKSVLNPPSKYVPNLLDKEKYFKKLDKGEYYIGLEEYKDQLNRESLYILNKNS